MINFVYMPHMPRIKLREKQVNQNKNNKQETMTNVVDQSAWWNPLLTSAIFTWLDGTATYITND